MWKKARDNRHKIVFSLQPDDSQRALKKKQRKMDMWRTKEPFKESFLPEKADVSQIT